MILCSAALITFNKYLMHKDRFPFPIALVLIHCLCCSAFSGVLLLVCPSLFPALSDPAKRISIDRSFVVRRALPVAALFSVSLLLSNCAYQYATVAFLQMVKLANVVLVYVISLAWGLQTWRAQEASVLLLIVCATLVTIRGELNYSATGFVLQGLCGFVESAKIVVQGSLLSGSGRKLDALSYVLVVTPLCALLLGATVAFSCAVVELPFVRVPGAQQWARMGPLLALNVALAFALNVVVALFIRFSSAMSFVVCNIAKDCVVVLGSAVVMHEPVSTLQAEGFVAQLALISLWSAMKAFPEFSIWERALIPCIHACVRHVACPRSSAVGGDKGSERKGRRLMSLCYSSPLRVTLAASLFAIWLAGMGLSWLGLGGSRGFVLSTAHPSVALQAPIAALRSAAGPASDHPTTSETLKQLDADAVLDEAALISRGYGMPQVLVKAMLARIARTVESIVHSSAPKPNVSIYFANEFFGNRPPVGGETFSPCPVNCEYHGDASRARTSEVVAYHMVGASSESFFLPERGSPKQLWIGYQIEPDSHSGGLRNEELLRHLNATMSTLLDGHNPEAAAAGVRHHIWTPLWTDYYFADPIFWRPLLSPWSRPRKPHLIFLQSGCAEVTKRTEFVVELRKFIPVDAYGPCLNNKDDPRARADPGGLVMEYVFYLALEPYELYTSEKIFRGLQHGAIVVFRGHPRVREFLPHPDAIIDADDFQSAEALAGYLHQVAKDPALWLKHTRWRSMPGQIQESFVRAARFQYIHSQCRACMWAVSQRDPLEQSEGWDAPLLASEGEGLSEQDGKLWSKFPLPKTSKEACWSAAQHGLSQGFPIAATSWPYRSLNLAKKQCLAQERCTAVVGAPVGLHTFYHLHEGSGFAVRAGSSVHSVQACAERVEKPQSTQLTARVVSNMQPWGAHTADRAFPAQDAVGFWTSDTCWTKACSPSSKFVQLEFGRQERLGVVELAMGNSEHALDVIQSGVLEASGRLAEGAGGGLPCADFSELARISSRGVLWTGDAAGVWCLRVRLLARQEAWVMLRFTRIERVAP